MKRSTHTCKGQSAWLDCCAKLKHGGLSLTQPKVATRSLFVKQVTKTFDGGSTNLHTILTFKVWCSRPDCINKWSKSTLWMLLRKHLLSQGSHIWKHVGEAWKIINEFILVLPPIGCYQVLQTNLWWNNEIQGIGYRFSKSRVAQLNKNGLCTIKDLWDDDTHQPLPWPTLDLRCKLDERERNHTNNFIQAIQAQWQQLIHHIPKQTLRGSCI